MEHTYIAIDLKSFYASAECVDRGLDPLTTHLVVADSSRTEKTICLAVSPSLKAYGISGRARLFEVVEKVKEINLLRQAHNRWRKPAGSSCFAPELEAHPEYALDYITAPPRMARYIEVSTAVYGVYLKYIAPEDIHVYSIDEVFMDVTHYLDTYRMTAHELARAMIRDVLALTGITATAGIGTNLYLCKVAMDIVAKHTEPDADGVRIAALDEKNYRERLWSHRPITDFWRVGRGYAKKLERYGLYTMGDIAHCSLYNEALLYKQFGVNTELLIDHAWGWEPCTMADIKAYKPSSNSISSGQVLHRPYAAEEARLIVREMTELLTLDLVDKRLVTDQMVLTIGYDIENLQDPQRRTVYHGEVTTDFYGRSVPKHAHGSVRIEPPSSSTRTIADAVIDLFDRITDKGLLVRRVTIAACNVIDEETAARQLPPQQLDLFGDCEAEDARRQQELKERKIQEATLRIQHRYGKNALLKGMNLEQAGTTVDRNRQIGGHHA